jgi:integrase
MATVKLILQQPYKKVALKVKVDKATKKKDKPLNPYETRLYCFLIIDREKIIKIKTKHVIFPKEWDFRNQGKKEQLAGSIEFNKKLRELKDDILLKYENTINEFPDMPFLQVANILKEYGKKLEVPFSEDNKGFFDYLDEYMIFLKGEVSPLTKKKYVTLKKSLTEFIKSNRKYENLTFSMIDHTFKDAFIGYLRNQKPRGRQKTRPEGSQFGLLNDTIGKYMETLKTFCKWAEERNYNKYSTYKDFKNFTKADSKRKTKKRDIVTLTLRELKQFYTHDFSNNPTLERVRDLWCFATFTLQRWSDIERFDKSQLNGNIWTFEAYKTKKETVIDLVGYFAPALDILQKYNFLLPKITLAKFNEYIKKAAKIAGITKETKKMRYVGSKDIAIIKPKSQFLSSHDARRTGISILLNDFNFPISHLMEITQHSNISTLQVYINPDREARREAASKTKRVDELLTVVKQKAG